MAITHLQLRRETYANWMSANPILAEGEPAYETDTKRYKLGDGVTTYALLRYSTRYGTTSLGSKRGNVSNMGEFQEYMNQIGVNTAGTVTVTPYTHGATVVAGAYAGGTLSPKQGRIYLSPYGQCTAAVWHYIDCNVASALVTPYTHGMTYHVVNGYAGGCYCPALDRIYLTPYSESSAVNYHYIDCTVSSTLIVPYDSTGWGVATGYYGGVYSGATDMIYFVPYGQAAQTTWYGINGITGGYNYIIVVATTASGYRGGCYAPSSKRVYLSPYVVSNAATWRYLDSTGAAVDYTHGVTAVSAGYTGAVYDPIRDRVWFIPFNQGTAAVWHYVDCASGAIIAYTHGATVVATGYWSGVYSPTQKRIYLIPYSQSTAAVWHYIDCVSGLVVPYTHGATVVATGYQGGCYDPQQNRIYLIPYAQSTAAVWHYIDCGEVPSGVKGGVSKWIAAGPIFNKF